MSQKPANQPTPANPSHVQGEGDYEAARNYRAATEQFIEDGKVDAAAHAAEPASEKEAAAMEAAESVGRAKAKH